MEAVLHKIYKNSYDDFINEINDIINRNKKMFIITANTETIMHGVENFEFGKILKKDEVIIVPDGIGVIKALKYRGCDISERITGIDLTKYLIKLCNDKNKSIYFYGAKNHVLKKLIEKIIIKYPNINIIGAKDGYSNCNDDVFNDIIEKKPDVILVAMGIPKQELLINKYYQLFEKGIFVGVGGSFDVLSEYKKRAPQVFIKLNLEWLYRLFREPARIKRFYKYNIKFIKYMKKEI